MSAALWLLCTAQLVGSGEKVTVELSSETAVVRAADQKVIAQAAVLGRTTGGHGRLARTHIKFEGGELTFHDIYGQARGPILKGLAEVSNLRCKKPK